MKNKRSTKEQSFCWHDFSKKYVLKTATGGYDGHGQKVITSADDLEEANALANSAECVLEEFVNFDLEISVIVSGNGKDVTVFPVQENIHRNNILSKTIVPARISDSLTEKAKAMAVKIAEQLIQRSSDGVASQSVSDPKKGVCGDCTSL